jgi:putative peptidoglycan lipid II flippase
VTGAPTRLSRATLGMATGTVLSRLTGFGRVAALAYALGFSRLTDTYNLANTTPNIVYELVIGGVLSGAVLVPLFVDQLSTRNEDEAWEAISTVVTLGLAGLAALTVLFTLAAPVVIRAYTFRLAGTEAEAQHEVAVALLRLFAPQVFFYGMVALATALLNARRRFVAPMVTPVLNNLVVIGVLVALPHLVDDLSLAGARDDVGVQLMLGLGTTAGVAAMALALLPSLRAANLGLRLRWAPRHPAVRGLLARSAWVFGYVVANQVALWVVLVLANGRSGDVSAYQAAFMFFLLPHGVVSVSIMTALTPDLAERWSTGDRDGYRRQLSLGLRTTAALLLPAAAGYAVLGRPLVSLLIEHGALSEASADTTGDLLSLFALGLPAFSAYLLLLRGYYAMQDTRTPFVLNAVENGLNVVLGLALYPSLGVQGLALAYALAYTGATGLTAWDLQRRTGGIDGREVGRSVARIAAATAVMAAGVAAVATGIGDAAGFALLARVTAAVGAGVTLYLLAAKLLGVGELAALTRIGRRAA